MKKQRHLLVHLICEKNPISKKNATVNIHPLSGTKFITLNDGLPK